MALSLYVLVFSVLLLVGSAWSSSAELEEPLARAGSHSLITCQDTSAAGKKLLFSTTFARSALFLQVRKERFNWPASGFSSTVINCIKVTDEIPNNYGGYVEITKGGLDSTYVEFLFTSQWYKRMSFSIEIYGPTPF
ncbi:uncharacterized protein CBL_14251 [Carabus blaptoides fortunei]